MIDDSRLLANATRYCHDNDLLILPKAKLGFGTDGSVWRTSRRTAVKGLYLEQTFSREVTAYQRLAECGLNTLHGLAIPELLGNESDLLVIEMTILRPPFLLDFGKAYVDRPPPYWNDEQLMANAYREWEELLDERWQEVAALLGALQSLGIYYVDPRPGNIVFRD